MIPASARDALAFLAAQTDQLIAFLRALIATPSITIERGERAIADVVVARTRALALDDPVVLSLDDAHPNLLYRVQGADDGPTLILNAHLDTQPVGNRDDWRHDPLGADSEHGRLYGLGASDMKGAVAAMVFALAALRHGGGLRRGAVTLALVSNEEDGGAFGAGWLVRHQGLRGDACVVGEPAGIGHEWQAIYTGQRGQSAVWLSAAGDQMHSGLAREAGARNAAIALARVMDALDRDLSIAPEGAMSGDGAAMAQVTIGVLMRCGVAWGVCPGRADCGVDVRTVPGMTREDVARGFDRALARLRRRHPEIAVSWRFAEPPSDWIAPTRLAEDSPLARAARAATGAVLGRVLPAGIYPATTDASAFAGVAGIPTIAALGPGRLALAHRPDEYVTLESVIEAARLYVVLAALYLEGRQDHGSSANGRAE